MLTPSVAMIGPDLDARGGISTVCRELLGAAKAEGVDCRYFGSMNTVPPLRKAAGMLRRQGRFLRAMAQGPRPDLFHIHLSLGASFARKALWFAEARALGRPVVLHLHAPDIAGFVALPGRRAALRAMLERADRVVALSRAMEATLLTEVGGALRIEVLYNPVDTVALAPPVAGGPRVLFMGEIGARKGALDLFSVIPAVRAAVPEATFVFCGNGAVEALRAQVQAAGLEGVVEVPGWVSGAPRLDQYRAAGVYCLPSYHEGLPMGILEAMAFGLPVVATPIAGVPEAVADGVSGALVPPGDRAALTARLIALLADPSLRARQGAAGRARALSTFSTPVLFRQLCDVWSRVVEEANIRPELA